MTSVDKPSPGSVEYQRQILAQLERAIIHGNLFHNIESGNGTSDKPLVNKVSYGPEAMMEVVLFLVEETKNQMDIHFDTNGTILKYSPVSKVFSIHESNNGPKYEAEILEECKRILEKMENEKNQIPENSISALKTKVVERIKSIFSGIRKF